TVSIAATGWVGGTVRTNRIPGAGIVAIRRRVATLLCGTLGAALAGTAMALPASATPGQLGGLNLAGYCQGLGDHGTTAIGPATLARGAITGPNFAYDNWACVTDSGVLVPITATGPAPSMTNACLAQYPGVASYTYPTD